MKIKVKVLEDANALVGIQEDEQTRVGIGSEIVNIATDDYDELKNKPQINSVVLSGNLSTAELGIKADASFVFTQMLPSSEWTIVHNLDKRPSITVVDSGDSVVTGDYTYIDNNTVKCIFSGEFSGKAYLN